MSNDNDEILNLEKEIEAHKTSMICSDNADNRYYSSGRQAEDRKYLKRLEQRLEDLKLGVA